MLESVSAKKKLFLSLHLFLAPHIFNAKVGPHRMPVSEISFSALAQND